MLYSPGFPLAHSKAPWNAKRHSTTVGQLCCFDIYGICSKYVFETNRPCKRHRGGQQHCVNILQMLAFVFALILSSTTSEAYTYDFYNTDEDIRYTRLYVNNPKQFEPTSLTFEFTLNVGLSGGEVIIIQMPGFTRTGAAPGSFLIRDDNNANTDDLITPLDLTYEGRGGHQLLDEKYARHFDLEYGAMAGHHTLHSIFTIAWREGHMGPDVTYPKNWMNGTLYLKVKPDRYLPADDVFKFTIRESVGFSTLCGMPALNGFPEVEQGHWYSSMRDSVDIGIRGITFSTNSSRSTDSVTTLMYSSQVGDGCWAQNWCSGHGYCDFCRSRCECEKTWGGDTKKSLGQMAALKHSTGSIGYDCSTRTCPVGISLRSLPTSNTEAHDVSFCVFVQ